VKTVFAIRSDRLSLLNKLSDKLRDIQETFYELAPLTYEQVIEAIENPAKKQNTTFDTQPFVFTPEAKEKIISELSESRKQSIDTTQLQIVCQQIEDIARKKQQQTLNASATQIELADLPKFDAIFYDFYNHAILMLPASNQENARKLIENQLIRNQQRISLDMNICTDYLNKTALDTLVTVHLLRAEPNTTGGTSYELSHDTLISPLLEARKKRIEKEEEARAEAERLEELRIANENAEKERIEREKEKKQQRKIIIIVSIAAIVAFGLAVFGLVMWQRSNKALLQADGLIRVIANTTDTVNIESYFELFRDNAFRSLLKGDEQEAKRNFKISLLTQDVPSGIDSSTFSRFNNYLIKVKGGSFMMGNPDSTMENIENERPVHKVTLSDFFISKYEITNA
jgi:hypothetical protein